MRSVELRGAPVTGFVPCFFSHGRMLVMSNIVPSGLQTGWLKGWREIAQKLKGSRLNGAFEILDFDTPEPALAE